MKGIVKKNMKTDLLGLKKEFAIKDTSYSSFWLYNNKRDFNSPHFQNSMIITDDFVDFTNDKSLLSEFNPAIAKNIISFWSEPGDEILDLFAGRTRAQVSYLMGRKYTGFEISKPTFNYIINTMEEKFPESKGCVEIYNMDCKNSYDFLYLGEETKIPLLFSCPPYWNIEKYGVEEGQLSNIKNYDIFLNELILRLNDGIRMIENGGFICLVVGDFRRQGKFITFHSDLINKMKDNKTIQLHDIIAIQNLPYATAAFYFGRQKKFKRTAKAHEYLLVWKKIE